MLLKVMKYALKINNELYIFYRFVDSAVPLLGHFLSMKK
jgi:hypothetical protein